MLSLRKTSCIPGKSAHLNPGIAQLGAASLGLARNLLLKLLVHKPTNRAKIVATASVPKVNTRANRAQTVHSGTGSTKMKGKRFLSQSQAN